MAKPTGIQESVYFADSRFAPDIEGGVWPHEFGAYVLFDEAKKKIDELRAAMFNLLEAAEAVLSNEEHAVSGGMRSYQEGSQTWQVYEDLRKAVEEASK